MKKLTAVRLKESTLEALQGIAEEDEETVSSLIRKAVEEFVQRRKAKK
jgi:predicted transcriptional regulator